MLRNGNLISDKLHRDRELYNQGNIRVADRSRRHHGSEWYQERLVEVRQLSWNTTPCCCNLRVGYTHLDNPTGRFTREVPNA